MSHNIRNATLIHDREANGNHEFILITAFLCLYGLLRKIHALGVYLFFYAYITLDERYYLYTNRPFYGKRKLSKEQKVQIG